MVKTFHEVFLSFPQAYYWLRLASASIITSLALGVYETQTVVGALKFSCVIVYKRRRSVARSTVDSG